MLPAFARKHRPVIQSDTPGGGGYGDPEQRPEELRQADLLGEYVNDPGN